MEAIEALALVAGHVDEELLLRNEYAYRLDYLLRALPGSAKSPANSGALPPCYSAGYAEIQLLSLTPEDPCSLSTTLRSRISETGRLEAMENGVRIPGGIICGLDGYAGGKVLHLHRDTLQGDLEIGAVKRNNGGNEVLSGG